VLEEDEEHHEVDSRVEVAVIEDEVDRGKVSRRRYFDIYQLTRYADDRGAPRGFASGSRGAGGFSSRGSGGFRGGRGRG
jgi:hypothetical protein